MAAWRSAKQWPLPNQKRTAYWFGSGTLGTAAPTAPADNGAKDEFTVDYSAEVSPDPRWGLGHDFPELAAHDAKGLSWTTPPLAAFGGTFIVTGPDGNLWITGNNNNILRFNLTAVGPGATTTSVVSSVNPSTVGQSVAFTATC